MSATTRDPSRPSRATLARLATILDRALADSYIERVWRPSGTSLLIDFRALGKRRLYASLATRHPWLAVTPRWPDTPSAPDRETLVLRKCLENARVLGVSSEDDRRLVFTLAPRHEHRIVLAVQLAGRYANAAVLDRTSAETELVRLIADRPAIDRESPPLPDGPLAFPDLDGDAWLDACAEAAWSAEDVRLLDARRSSLLQEARTAHQRKRRALEALGADLARARGREALRHQGELLKASLHRAKVGMASIDVVDWADPEARTIAVALDPTLSPSDNLQRLFARYKKLTRGELAIAERLVSATRETAQLAELVDRLVAASSAELDRVEADLRKAGVRAPTPAGSRAVATRLPYRRFSAADGTEILVGKSAADNDALTFQVARGADLFLHARDVAGSHVILRRVGRSEPSSEALLDAAALAAWGSKLRSETLVDVLYTERKHVRKPRGAAAGLVQTAAPRTITVRLDPARIERLYATLDPHERDA